MAIGKENECHPSRTQHTVNVPEKAEWVGQVLEHVATDNEVLSRIPEGAKQIYIEVTDNVGSGKLGPFELREEDAILLRVPPVNVLNRRSRYL
jgi:hypothetical protein